MSKRAFGELESEILYLLRDGQRHTVKEIHKKLGVSNNYNTVMTVMTRLAQKKVLDRERVGLQYEYWLISPSNALSFVDKIKQKFSGVKTSALVSHLIDTADDLSDAEIKEIEEIIRKVKKRDEQ